MPCSSNEIESVETLETLVELFSENGCRQILIKVLSDNDNSKNQVYFGGDFSALNFFHNLTIVPSDSGERESPIFKAALNFSWIDRFGNTFRAPNAQLILYPQYPEVRFSGFLKGAQCRPSKLMHSREAGRTLFLGLKPDGEILGHVVASDSSLSAEVLHKTRPESTSVFRFIQVNVDPLTDNKALLVKELARIYRAGWINSKRLDRDGALLPCNSTNCGGYTLEAELGVLPNGDAKPDYLGWEIKQHSVRNFKKVDQSSILTLMTPEPTGGFYKEKGFLEFINHYGYDDHQGRENRKNFGGIYKFGKRLELTGLTLQIEGYDLEKKKITSSSGKLLLLDDNDNNVASWDFSSMLVHWNKKHAQAAYIPSIKRDDPLMYCYGYLIRLCEGTDFFRFLDAVISNKVYYDPGIKLITVNGVNSQKKRSQFRVKSVDIPLLYQSCVITDLREVEY